jgi:hypothetical protein
MTDHRKSPKSTSEVELRPDGWNGLGRLFLTHPPIERLFLLKTLNAGETPGFRWLSEF